MRGVQKQLLAAALAALLALALVSCGGDDGGDDTTAPSGSATTQEAPGSNAGEGGSSGQDDGGSGESGGSTENGGSGEASAEFRTPGGDNSIQSFGEEADSAELEAASTALAGFLDARADGDWAGACEQMAKAAVKPLEQLLSSSNQQKGKGCAAALAAVIGRAPASTRENTMTGGIASLRVEGDRAFALYHGPEGVDYFVPMVSEDGEWKVGALAPSEFP